jgi:mRNA interferase MazF
MSLNYIPERGDIVWLDLSSDESVQEPGERKSVLVISPKTYNGKTGLAIICPIKGKVKDYPFEVIIPEDSKIKGVILADQVKSLNWKTRNAEFICKLADGKFSEVVSKSLTLL